MSKRPSSSSSSSKIKVRKTDTSDNVVVLLDSHYRNPFLNPYTCREPRITPKQVSDLHEDLRSLSIEHSSKKLQLCNDYSFETCQLHFAWSKTSKARHKRNMSTMKKLMEECDAKATQFDLLANMIVLYQDLFMLNFSGTRIKKIEQYRDLTVKGLIFDRSHFKI